MSKKSYLEILDLEHEDSERFASRIGEAADKAAAAVDQETIRMYLKAKIKLPPRLQRIYDKFPHDRLVAQFRHEYGVKPGYVKLS